MALKDRHRQFGAEYLVGLSATEAAIRAGYSGQTTSQQAYHLLQKTSLQGTIHAALAAHSAERTEITQDWVIERLVANVTRAMQAVPILDRDGKETGRYNHHGSGVANRALELLGKHTGLWTERRDPRLPKRLAEMDEDEIRALLGDSYVTEQHAEEDYPPAGEPPTRKLN